jgi:hypothetical protein
MVERDAVDLVLVGFGLRKISAVALSWRSGRSPLEVMLATRERPRSGQNTPEPTMR